MIVGAIIGAGLGAAFVGGPAARSNDAETKVALPILGFAAGAFLGGEIGHHIHQHGAVLYSRN